MPRRPRLDYPGAVHHVVARGIERTEVFVDDRDRERFVERLADAVERDDLGVYAWALMPNHVHVVVASRAGKLSAAVQRVLGSYALWFNRRHNRPGHLFQNRFKSILVEREGYLREVIRYVHLNPLRAGLVSSLEDLDCYPWTGHAALLSPSPPPWQAVDSVLRLFARRAGEARRAYRAFVAQGVPDTERNLEQSGGLRDRRGRWVRLDRVERGRESWSTDERVLGSAPFVSAVLRQQPPRPAALGDERIAVLQELLLSVAASSGVPVGLIASRSITPRAVAARAAFCSAAVQRYGCTLAALARVLGISRTSVARALAREPT